MTEIRKQIVFIDSSHSDDINFNHNDFSINFSDAQIRCEDDENITMELFDFVGVNSVYQIEPGINDRFFVQWVINAFGQPTNRYWIVIPKGNYTGTTLAAKLQTLLGAAAQLTWSVTFDSVSHEFTFDVTSWGSTSDLLVEFVLNPNIATTLPPSPPSDGSIYSSPSVQTVLGVSLKTDPGTVDTNHNSQYIESIYNGEIKVHFRKGDHSSSQSARFISNVPISLGGALTSFTLNTNIPNKNLETTPSLVEGMKYSSVMARIPVMVPTGGVIYYHTMTDNNIQLILPQRYVDNIKFTIRDAEDGPVQFKQKVQFTLIFRVKKKFNKELNDPTSLFGQMIEHLKDIAMINKMSFISKNPQ